MRVVIGRIGRAHGVRGDLSVDLRTDEPARRFAAGQVVHAADRTLTITSSRPHQGRLLVSFAEVADRTAAEGLRGVILEAEVSPDETPSGAEEFYDRQLIGLVVVDAAGREIGRILEVLHLPAHDLLAIDAKGREVLVPFVTELVPQVDLDGGKIHVADVPGLLDPDQAEEAR